LATDMRARGLRNPRHDFMVNLENQRLCPVFAAPVRPRETIVGWRFAAEVLLGEMVKLAWAPTLDIEFGVWKVPISTLGEYFADLFVADFEDSGGANLLTPGPLGSGTGMPGSPSVAFHGPNSMSAFQNRTRTWAGEMAGQADSENQNVARVYTPYVSAATYHVARTYYEMELEAGNRERVSPDLWQSPPLISSRVKGMSQSAVGANLHDDSIPIGGVAEWAERLSLLSRRNRTYGEYLQGFGVPLSRVRSMPEPLLIRRVQMDRRIDTAQVWGTVFPGSAAIPPPSSTAGTSNYTGTNYLRLDEYGGTAPVMLSGLTDAGLGMMYGQIDLTRKRRIIVDEPSIILGTALMYEGAPSQNDFDHILDVTRLISGSLWGDNNSDEIDFITSQQLPGAIATTRTFGAGQPTNPAVNPGFASVNNDLQNGPYVMNALNLFLNGDRFSNDVWAFRYLPSLVGLVPPADGVTIETTRQRRFTDSLRSLQVNCIGRYMHGVATELVS